MRIAIINPETNIVENTVEGPQGKNVWFAPENKIAVVSEEAAIGDLYQNGQFIKQEQSLQP